MTLTQSVRPEQIVRHGLAGLVATVTMSAVMAAAKAGGLLDVPPPKQITAKAERKGGLKPHHMQQETFSTSWIAAHAAFGMACGVVYGIVRGLGLLPQSRMPAGLLYGEAIWATNYAGLLPALGLYPPPDDDRPSRTATMIAAHAVYGATLAALVD